MSQENASPGLRSGEGRLASLQRTNDPWNVSPPFRRVSGVDCLLVKGVPQVGIIEARSFEAHGQPVEGTVPGPDALADRPPAIDGRVPLGGTALEMPNGPAVDPLRASLWGQAFDSPTIIW